MFFQLAYIFEFKIQIELVLVTLGTVRADPSGSTV